MKRKTSIYFIFCLLATLAIPNAQPCAPAPPQGTYVSILEESAIILWDSARKMQHFIRRASFRSDAADFGFLVPTPSKPELAEVSNDAFQVAAEIMKPRVIEVNQRGIRPGLLLEALFFRRLYETAAAPAAVRMLEMKQVAGYDAAVLEADDAAALTAWLQQHGYPSSPALQKWFEPYIAAKWKITAFKISGDRNAQTVGSSTVRMSFPADRPFFPYREPQSENAEQGNRALQVLLLSDARMEGVLGDGSQWPGHLQWADRIAPENQARLLRDLGLQNEKLPQGLWLNAFEDLSSPRPGHDDLFFHRASQQSKQVPPPYVISHDRRIPIPLDLLLVIGIVIAVIVVRRRR